MIKIKYGFIARVAINGYDPLPKAPAIYELGSYPEYHIIERARAEDFCRRINDALPTDDISRKFAEDCIREILFDEKQWEEILAAFDGRIPEVMLWDTPPIINKRFTRPLAPENIQVKFRLALDENGNQMRAADYIKPIKTAQNVPVGRVETQMEDVMKTIKYGYIARTAGTWGLTAEIPPKAFVVSEGMRYPNVFCIEPKRAEDFLLVPVGINIPTIPPIVACGILFSKEQWDEIIKSFDGYEPEIFLCDVPPMIEAIIIPPERKRLTTENLRVKLRVAFDENGKRITTAYTEGLKSRGIPNQPKSLLQPPSKRQQMIQRLVEHQKVIVLNRVGEYASRLNEMADERIEKEYSMEFGE